MKPLTIDLTRPTSTDLTTQSQHSTSMAEYSADEATAKIVDHYRGLIVWRPEGGGPAEAASVPTKAEREALVMRTRSLQLALRPAQMADADKRKIGAAIARMLGGYTSLRNADTRGLVAALVQSLWQFPAWATVVVCDKVHDGLIPGLNPAFAPAVPELCQLIRAEIAVVVVEQARIAEALALVARDAEPTEEEKAARKQNATAWLKRDDPRAAALLASLPGQRDDDTARTEAINRRVFERECAAAGVDPALGVSPTLLKTLEARQ